MQVGALRAPTCIRIPPYSSRTAPIHQYTPKQNNTPTYSPRFLRMNVITFDTCWAIKNFHKVTSSWFNLFNYYVIWLGPLLALKINHENGLVVSAVCVEQRTMSSKGERLSGQLHCPQCHVSFTECSKSGGVKSIFALPEIFCKPWVRF